jgi:hypothetical protein
MGPLSSALWFLSARQQIKISQSRDLDFLQNGWSGER